MDDGLARLDWRPCDGGGTGRSEERRRQDYGARPDCSLPAHPSHSALDVGRDGSERTGVVRSPRSEVRGPKSEVRSPNFELQTSNFGLRITASCQATSPA